VCRHSAGPFSRTATRDNNPHRGRDVESFLILKLRTKESEVITITLKSAKLSVSDISLFLSLVQFPTPLTKDSSGKIREFDHKSLVPTLNVIHTFGSLRKIEKIGKLYSAENTTDPNAFFTPHLMDLTSSNSTNSLHDHRQIIAEWKRRPRGGSWAMT
jgi:hypothetical protein